jgi:hypothetical protein
VRPDRVDTGQRFAARLASGLATRSGRRYKLSMQSQIWMREGPSRRRIAKAERPGVSGETRCFATREPMVGLHCSDDSPTWRRQTGINAWGYQGSARDAATSTNTRRREPGNASETGRQPIPRPLVASSTASRFHIRADQ